MNQNRLARTLPSIGVAAGLFLIFLPLLSTEITWANHGADGGDFLTAALVGGVPHSSGYPAYMLLLRAFLLVPFGSFAWRGALLSALCAALAGGLLCRWVQLRLLANAPRAWIASALAGFAWGSAPLVFSQAVIVEVYAFQALFAALFLFWFSEISAYPPFNRPALALLSLAVGFGLGGHLTFLLLVPAGAFALVSAFRRGLPQARSAWTFLPFLCGLAVYLYLPLAARASPPVNWGGANTPGGFWWLLSGSPYRGLLLSAPASGVVERIPAWARLLLEQFGLTGLALGVFGGVYSAPAPRPERWLPGFLLAAYSLFAILFQTGDSLVYLIPAYLGFAAWMALGAHRLLAARWRGLPVGVLLVSAAALLVLLRLPAAAAQSNPNADRRAAAFVEASLSAAPGHALVITAADRDTFALWYAHFGLRRRPDLRVLVDPLGQFGWYRDSLRRAYPDLSFPPPMEDDWVAALVRLNPGRPVCHTINPSDPETIALQCAP